MSLFLFATVLATLLTALTLAKAGLGMGVAWALPLLPGLAWLTLRGADPARIRVGLRVPPSHQPLAHFAQHSGQPALLVEERRVAHANQALLRALGMEGRGDELIGLPFENIVHPRQHARLAKLLAADSDTGDAGLLTLLRTDGLPWRARVSLFRGERSPVVLLHFSAPDDAGHAQPQLQWGRRLAHYAGEILFALDEQFLVAWLNPQWERSTARASDEVLHSPFLQLFPAEDRAALTKGLRALQARERDSLVLEVRLLTTRTSGPRWVELRAWPLELGPGEEPGIGGMLIDIDLRRRKEEALRAQRRSLNTMLDKLPGMIYRGQNDRNWTMEFVSEGCFELTGYTPLELVEHHAACFASLIHPEDWDFVWDLVQMRIARRERYELTYRIVDRDGVIRWVWEQGQGIYSSQGELLGLEGYITDVSSSRGAQEEARRRLFFDYATGLLSSSLFLDRLQHVFSHAAIGGYPFAVLHLGIESLEQIGSTHGAAMAERALVEVGKRLRIVHGDCNGASRQGDAFAVLISDFRPSALGWASPLPAEISEERGIRHLAATLANVLSQPLRIDGHSIAISVHIGFACGREHFPDATTMLVHAAQHRCPGRFGLAIQ